MAAGIAGVAQAAPSAGLLKELPLKDGAGSAAATPPQAPADEFQQAPDDAPAQRPSLLVHLSDEAFKALKAAANDVRPDEVTVPSGGIGPDSANLPGYLAPEDQSVAPLDNSKGTSLATGFKIVKPDDALLAGSDYAKDHPHIPWLQVGLTVPANLGAMAQVGPFGIAVNASGEAAYKVLLPAPLTRKGLLSAARDLSLGVPLTSENALALPQGTQYLAYVAGAASTTANLGAGLDVSAGPFNVTGFAGLSGGLAGARSKQVNVKRLTGNDVYFQSAALKDASAFAAVGASLSADIDNDSLRQTLGSALGNAVADNGRGAVTSNGAAEAVFRVRAALDIASERGIIFHMNDPLARVAFDALVKHDPLPLARLIASHASAVTVRQYHARTRTKEKLLRIAAGPAKLALLDRLRQDIHFRGKTSNASGVQVVTGRKTLFSDTAEGLFGNRTVTWEAVASSENDGPPTIDFHLVLDRSRGHTGPKDVSDFQALGRLLGATWIIQKADPRAPQHHNLVGRAVNRVDTLIHPNDVYGPTDEHVELFITNDGVTKIHASSDQDRANALRKALAQLGEPPDEGAVQKFVRELAPLTVGSDPRGWTGAFQRLGADDKFNIAAAVGALELLAGGDQTVVHQFSLDSRKADNLHLAAQDAGELGDASANPLDADDVGALLEP